MKKMLFCDILVVALAVISAVLFLVQGNFSVLLPFIFVIVCVFGIHNVSSRLSLPFALYFLLMIFVVLSLIMGKMWNFYGKVPQWDFWLHFYSGIILASIGKKICLLLLPKSNPALLFWFAFLFGSATAGLWEVFEFFGDFLFHLNSQGGSLQDTMTDIIAGNISCLLFLFLSRSR